MESTLTQRLQIVKSSGVSWTWASPFYVSTVRLTYWASPSCSFHVSPTASHLSLGAWVILMGVFGLAFYKGGIDLSWLYTFLGIILGPAVFPLVTCICWKKTSRNAAMTSTLIGLLCGMTTWLISAWKISGEISIPSLGTYDSSLAGSAVSFFLPLFIIVPWSLLLPDNFDWKITRRINSPHNIKNSNPNQSQTLSTLPNG